MGLEIVKGYKLGTEFKTSELYDNDELMIKSLGETCKLVKITFSFVGETEILSEIGVSSKDFNEEDYEL